MPNEIIGARIRQRRREAGMTQAALATTVGISASYLNLIERLVDALIEIAHLPSLDGLDIETGRCNQLIGRFPGWAKGIAALARAERDAMTRARTLSDRLSNDPFLRETVHRMLTRITAIRSAAGIIADYPDLNLERRGRFDRIIREESDAIAAVGEALARYLDRAEELNPVLTPLDEVEAFFESRGNRFGEIEMDTAPLSHLMDESRPLSRKARARTLVDESLTGLIEHIVAGAPLLRSSAARNRARAALQEYAVNAILMPIDIFSARSAELAYDVEALAEEYALDVAAVCHRLTALPDRGGVPRFGYFRSNAAGTIINMLGLKGLAIPRYSAACPLWALFRAQQSPETIIRQRALFPSGDRFVFVARAHHVGQTGFGKPRHYLTDMIAMTETDAERTVYAPAPTSPVEEVGPSCRLCPRRTCRHRVDDPLAG
jgi:predicted transcriptional regulator/transcriptional regulator with XRE-family HTH domain